MLEEIRSFIEQDNTVERFHCLEAFFRCSDFSFCSCHFL